MYVSKFGANRDYPPSAGEGFWNTLRNVPTRGRGIVPGSDSIFVCSILGTPASPTALDYREPNRPVADGLYQPQWPIACDRPTNHDPSGQGDIIVLHFSGSVSTATWGSPEWDTAMGHTQ